MRVVTAAPHAPARAAPAAASRPALGGAGAVADVTVLAIDHGRFTLSDSLGEEITSSMRLRPEITVRAGKVSRPDSPLLGRSLSRAA